MEAGGLAPSGGILGYMTGGFFDDDYDPLAPMQASDEARADSESVGSFGPGDEDGPLDLGDVDDGGYGDGVVRIWVDDDGRLPSNARDSARAEHGQGAK